MMEFTKFGAIELHIANEECNCGCCCCCGCGSGDAIQLAIDVAPTNAMKVGSGNMVDPNQQ